MYEKGIKEIEARSETVLYGLNTTSPNNTINATIDIKHSAHINGFQLCIFFPVPKAQLQLVCSPTIHDTRMTFLEKKSVVTRLNWLS